MRTSYSALETFKQCPQKYKFQEIDKIKAPKSKEAVFGTLIHSSLHHMFSRDPLFPTLDEVVAHFRDAWSNEEKLSMTQEEKALYLEQGENILKRFYAKNAPWNFNVVDLESRFEVVVEDPKTGAAHILAGIMDRIDKPQDDAYEIIDYKTTRKMKSQEAVDSDLQLSLYHLGLTRRWPHIAPDAIRLSLYYVKHGEKISTTRTAQQTEHTSSVVLGMIRAIEVGRETGEFPPQPSALCDWCGYKPLCPAWKYLYQKKDTGADTAIENIDAVLAEFFTLKKTNQETEQRLAALQGILKTYMEREGLTRLFSNEGTVAKKIQERFAYDFDKVKVALEAADRADIWQALFAPDEKKLKQLVKTLPLPLRQQIDEARTLAKRYEILTVSTKKQSAPDHL